MSVIVGKHRRWVFTWNNYPEELDDFIAWLMDYKFVFGFEKGEKGTPHLQGYVEFNGGVTYSYVRKHAGCFWEPAKGDDTSNWEYCTKGEDFVTSHPDGFPVKEQGKRNDIHAAKKILNEGGGMRDVLTHVNSYQAARHSELYLKYMERPRNHMTKVTWIWGPSGSGKTTMASELAGPDAWWASEDGRWFDGYDAHANVVIDELRPENWHFPQLLRLLDSKPMQVPVKGGFRQWKPTHVFITTIRCPAETYEFLRDEPMEQLLRRISTTVELPIAQEVGGVIRADTPRPPASACLADPPDDYDLQSLLEQYLTE